MNDPIERLLTDAFVAVCAAEKLIYAGGGNRADKDDIIRAHSHLLALRMRHSVPVSMPRDDLTRSQP